VTTSPPMDGDTVWIGEDAQLVHHRGQWMLWCFCGDIIDVRDIVGDQCPNCDAARQSCRPYDENRSTSEQ
jgi:hypothetical protein